MASINKDYTPKCGNPYKILELLPTDKSTTTKTTFDISSITSAQIKKAFRKLSLKLHPDKREKTTSKQKEDELDKQFIQVQEAKSFLLDVEHASDKEKYDLQLESEYKRSLENDKREREMDDRRRNMRDSLKDKLRKESDRVARRANRGTVPTTTTTSTSGEDYVNDLKQAGKRMREEYNERQYQKEYNQETKRANAERKKKKEEMENRQVRLKWSRKKIGGQSEDCIVKILQSALIKNENGIGESIVEEVELIGSKGNAALVTFYSPKYCKPCVDNYLHSQDIRATYVGKRKEKEENIDSRYDDGLSDDKGLGVKRNDRESVEEMKLRQAAERERILRQMEVEEEGGHNKNGNEDRNQASRKEDSNKMERKSKASFPPKFPTSSNTESSQPLQRLEEMESTILKQIFAPDALQELLNNTSFMSHIKV